MDFLFDFQRNLKKKTREDAAKLLTRYRMNVCWLVCFVLVVVAVFLFVDLLRFTITSNQLPFILNYKLNPKLCVYVYKTETCVFLIFFLFLQL